MLVLGTHVYLQPVRWRVQQAWWLTAHSESLRTGLWWLLAELTGWAG